MEVKMIPAEATYNLRARVLRPGQPPGASHYPRDGAGVHFGAFEEGRLLSVVTAHPEDSPLFPKVGQWRIRGMATEPELQGRGVGKLVLEALLAWGRAQGIPLFWCNARMRAIPFYLKAGFSVESELFEIDGIGAHKVLRMDLGAGPAGGALPREGQ
jgi:GNAT superfamily N-acetyltransferase